MKAGIPPRMIRICVATSTLQLFALYISGLSLHFDMTLSLRTEEKVPLVSQIVERYKNS